MKRMSLWLVLSLSMLQSCAVGIVGMAAGTIGLAYAGYRYVVKPLFLDDKNGEIVPGKPGDAFQHDDSPKAWDRLVKSSVRDDRYPETSQKEADGTYQTCSVWYHKPSKRYWYMITVWESKAQVKAKMLWGYWGKL